MPHLFEALHLRSITLPNRIAVSPMCEYSVRDGFANDWHLVHLGSRAVGGAGLVFTEAAAVLARRPHQPAATSASGRTSTSRRSPASSTSSTPSGAHAGIQLAHAGRKASMNRPWDGRAPSPPEAERLDQRRRAQPLAFADGYRRCRTSSTHAGIDDDPARLRRRRPPRARRRLRRRRDPRRPRLPAARVPLAALQPPHRRIRRQLRKPRPPAPRDRLAVRGDWPAKRRRSSSASPPPTGPTEAGTSTSPSRWPAPQAARRRPDRLLLRRQRRRREDSHRPRLPGALRRTHPPRSRNRHRAVGHDHRTRAGRPDHAHRPGRPRAARPRNAPRSLLAAARRPELGQQASWPHAVSRAAPPGSVARPISRIEGDV